MKCLNSVSTLHGRALSRWRTACIGLAAVLLMAAYAHPSAGQPTAGRVTISAADRSVKDIIRQIESSTSYRFFYSDDIAFLNTRRSIDMKDADLNEVLSRLLEGSNLAWEIGDNNGVVITPFDKRRMTISGRVTDENGPVIGASVILKGTQKGVTTDAQGDYTIDVGDTPAPVLQFSCLGYQPLELAVGGSTTLNAVMTFTTSVIDDIVIVGYGSMRRRDLVGSVDQIDNKMISERANPNISRSLQGLIPNLNITMRDGKPSRDATINVRGTGSIGSGGSALILIDGVEGEMSAVNPADVESISVLKDASSAAIYGARGAFGVILITTKKGSQGQAKVTYNGSVSIHRRTVVPELVTNGLQWTEGWLGAWNGYYNGSRQPETINNIIHYSLNWFEELKRRDGDRSLDRVRLNNNNRYEYFGNTDWHKIFFKDYNVSHEHNVNVSGGTKDANYYVSGRFYNNDGIYNSNNDIFKQYNLRGRGEISIRPWMRLQNTMDFIVRDYHQPMLYYSTQLPQRMMEHAGNPVTIPTNPDGTWTYAAVLNGWAGFAEDSSYQQEDKYNMRNTLALEIDLLKDVLMLKGDYTYNYGSQQRTRVTNMYDGYDGPESVVTVNQAQGSTLTDRRITDNYQASNIYADFTPDLGTYHALKILGGWNLETRKYRSQTIKREGLVMNYKPSFGLMNGITSDPTAGGYDWSYVGAFFRVNYGYRGRYLAEVSGRYDGSSKFPENQKWGFFPSGSVGWRLSEENFMKWSRPVLGNFKIRLSAGSMGNGNVDPYKYIDYMSLATSTVVIGDALETYTSAPGAIPLSLTWEKSTTYDVGIDADFFNNRLNFVYDYYRRYTTDMYTVGVALPSVFGTSSPKGNNASLETRGWEVSVAWRDTFKAAGKPFGYSVKVMVWDAESWVTKYENPTGSLSDYYKGMKLGEIWGYRVLGLFADQAEINSHASQNDFLQSSDKVTRPGDLKIADLDNSGNIDKGANTLEDHGDLEIIGNTTPRYSYGLNLSANWNGIGVSMFFQGVGKKNWYPRYDSGYFWGQYNRPFGYMLKAHTGDNVYREELGNTGAYWPRYSAYQTHESTNSRLLTTPNDRYLQNVGYLRLKNITLDYTFPEQICKKLRLKGLRVYAAGENLFTWSKLFKYTDNYDPEVINAGDSDFRTAEGDGYSYPMMKSITFGLNITF